MGLSLSLAFLGSKASSLCSITDLLCSLMFRAVCTAVLFITLLNAMTEDSAVAVGANGCHGLDANGCHGLDCAFELAKYSCFSILIYLEGFVASWSQVPHFFTVLSVLLKLRFGPDRVAYLLPIHFSNKASD